MTPAERAESRARRADFERAILVLHRIATLDTTIAGSLARHALDSMHSELARDAVRILDAPL